MSHTKYMFFPGCSLPSYNPNAVGQILAHLQDRLPNVGAMLKCCGKPTKAMGQEALFKERYLNLSNAIAEVEPDEIIVACQSCYLTMREYSPNVKVRSLWTLLPEIGLPDRAIGIGRGSDATFAIHDSCSTRDRADIHAGIRWIMTELGYETEEPEHTKENTLCCGFGGMALPANPDLANRVMHKRTSEVKSDYMVSYCAACRASMHMGGKKSLHILDLVFGEQYTSQSEFPGVDGPASSWLKRYQSKQKIKALLL